MQRRAAAAYVVFFVLIAGLAYAMIATAQAPAVDVDEPEITKGVDETFTVDGRTYTVSEITAEEEEGGGHGGGGGLTLTAALTWTNESARYTETFEADGSVDIGNTTYDVVLPNESDPTTATLREQPGDDLETVERDGETFVIVEDDEGNEELVHIDEYEPLDRIELAEDEPFEYRGNSSDVTVTSESLTIAWTAPRTNTVELNNEANVTLNGQRYFVFIPDESTVQFTTNYGDYAEDLERKETFEERMNGFWGVTILSGLAAILLTGLAYLPRKEM